jgi:hypothetical protein
VKRNSDQYAFENICKSFGKNQVHMKYMKLLENEKNIDMQMSHEYTKAYYTKLIINITEIRSLAHITTY